MSRSNVAIACVLPLSLGVLTSLAPAQEPSTARVEKDITISAEMPALRPTCGASVSVEYFQSDTLAKVQSTIAVEGCAVATGEYTIAARIRDESGEVKTLEFQEAFRSDDEQTLARAAEYPIGENVELVSVRTRNMRCTCVEQAH